MLHTNLRKKNGGCDKFSSHGTRQFTSRTRCGSYQWLLNSTTPGTRVLALLRVAALSDQSNCQFPDMDLDIPLALETGRFGVCDYGPSSGRVALAGHQAMWRSFFQSLLDSCLHHAKKQKRQDTKVRRSLLGNNFLRVPRNTTCSDGRACMKIPRKKKK